MGVNRTCFYIREKPQKGRGQMANSNFPFYGNNTFDINSVNQFNLEIFNPYSLYYYTVTIISPLFEQAPTDLIEAPTVTFQDFLDWCGTYVEIDSEKHALYRLATLLIDVASEYVDVNLTGVKNYKRIVSLYAGHYLELHLKMLKDEANSSNFNPEDKDKVIAIEPLQGSKHDFRQTISGAMFWSLYGTISRFAGSKTNSNDVWGLF
jgi:hypothetical protein